MLKIRKAQMTAMRVGRFVRRHDMEEITTLVIRRLRQQRVIAPPEQGAERSGPSPLEQVLRRMVAAEVRQALLYGFETMSAMTQFTSYAFMLSPDWRNDAAVMPVLDSDMDARDKLKAIHQHLAAI